MHSSVKERERLYLEEEHKWKVISLPGLRIKVARKSNDWKRQNVLAFRLGMSHINKDEMTRGENLVASMVLYHIHVACAMLQCY